MGVATAGLGKLLFSLPKEAVTVAKSGLHLLYYRIELTIAGQEKGLRINFGSFGRSAMEQIAASLPAAASAAAPPQAGRHR